jgi:tetratricopeptide (TPR) repeat protein
MTRTKVILLSITVVAIAGAILGLRVWRQAASTQAAWAAAMPGQPDLSHRPEELRHRVADAQARALSTHDPAALGELARLYHANGDLHEAEQAYRGLLQFDPKNAKWPHLLSALLAGYGRLDEAIPLLQTAVALAPDYAPARLRLADSLLKANRLDEAKAMYTDLSKRDPKNGYALLGLARIDLAEERLTAAREKLTRAAAADPTFYGAQSLLTSVFEQLGDEAAAAAARARANQAGRFKEAPDPWLDGLTEYCYDVYRLQVAAATDKSTGDTSAAVPILLRARSLAPDDPRTLRQLGACYVALHDYAHAKEPLERAVAVAPNDPAGYVELTGLYFGQNDIAGAMRILDAGLKACSDTAALHGELGLTLLNLGRTAEAVPHLEEAVRLSPEKPEPARDLVLALFSLNRQADGAIALKDALSHHPDFPPLLILGARFEVEQHHPDSAQQLINRAEHAGASPGELARVAGDFRRQFGHNP